jgi:hypothetical protein
LTAHEHALPVSDNIEHRTSNIESITPAAPRLRGGSSMFDVFVIRRKGLGPNLSTPVRSRNVEGV